MIEVCIHVKRGETRFIRNSPPCYASQQLLSLIVCQILKIHSIVKSRLIGEVMFIGYVLSSALAWTAPQDRIYSCCRSNPRCRLLRERGVETNIMVQRSPRLGLRSRPWLILRKLRPCGAVHATRPDDLSRIAPLWGVMTKPRPMGGHVCWLCLIKRFGTDVPPATI
jgi:hypothetical protein